MNSIRGLFSGHNNPALLRSALVYMLQVLALTLLVGAGQICLGQSDPQEKKINTVKGCSGINLENEKYVVRSSRVESPFDFLPWVRIKLRRAADKISALIDNKPFVYNTVVDEASKIIKGENFLPDSRDFRFRIEVELTSVENCSNQSVDVIYTIASTQIMPVLSSSPEARATEKQAPEATAGLTNVDAPAAKQVHLIPIAGYDSENKIFGGGRLEISPKSLWEGPINRIMVEAKGSSNMRFIAAELSGSTDSLDWLSHIEWRLNFTNYSLPTGVGSVGGGHLSAQVSGMTKPFANGNLSARFGALLEGGNSQSDVRDVQLAADTLEDSPFGALKFYAGLSGRLSRNVFSASYGLELGAAGRTARVDWHKHIGDVKHEVWYPLGDHRALDLESRFTVGAIQVPGKIPQSERFFGGNNEEPFMPGETWEIRKNPVIRAIPGSRFFRAADGAGGDRFFSYNLTAAYTLYREPLTPRELTGDAEFKSILQDSLATITRNLKRTFLIKDQHYIKMTEQFLPKAPGAMDGVKAAVQNAQTARPGQSAQQFTACLRVINTAIRRVKSAVESKQNYSTVVALLAVSAEEGDNWLGKVIECVTDLNNSLHDPAITTAINDLDSVRKDMEAEFQQIDQAKAQRLAEADMAFTRRTLNTLFDDVNIYSVSPVFVFDVAKIGPEGAGSGGVRYGPGAGIRVELVSMVHFTAGYAWNIRKRPGEGSGTVFFSLGLRDIFY